MFDAMPADGWIGTQGLEIVRWAYIDDKDFKMQLYHDLQMREMEKHID